MPKPPTEYANAPLLEVRIMTNRLLSAETTEKVLNALNKVDNIRQINIVGESLPEVIGNGPGKGYANNHTERRTIKVAGKEVELKHLVGSFYIELAVESDEQLESTIEGIRKACDKTIPFGYTMDMGRYSKYRSSLNDYRSV